MVGPDYLSVLQGYTLRCVFIFALLFYHTPWHFSTKILSMANTTPYFYRPNGFSSFHFSPFKLFCFSYKIFRSLQSSFIRTTVLSIPPYKITSEKNNIPLNQSTLKVGAKRISLSITCKKLDLFYKSICL